MGKPEERNQEKKGRIAHAGIRAISGKIEPVVKTRSEATAITVVAGQVACQDYSPSNCFLNFTVSDKDKF